MAMNHININSKISEVCTNIFYNYNISELSSYQKRTIIFDYLCDSLEYDWDLYESIVEVTKEKNRTHRPVKGFRRDSSKELHDAIFHNKGICNAIAQYYKLLLQHMNIYSVQICCHDNTEVNHALNLVYDEEHNTYSFDDITSVIVDRGTKEQFFDYDIEDAYNMNQGQKTLFNNKYWYIIPSCYINYLADNINDNFYQQFNLETIENEVDIPIPENIISLKKLRNKAK